MGGGRRLMSGKDEPRSNAGVGLASVKDRAGNILWRAGALCVVGRHDRLSKRYDLTERGDRRGALRPVAGTG